MRIDRPKCTTCGILITENWTGKCKVCRAVKCSKCGYTVPNKTLRGPKEMPCVGCARIAAAKNREIEMALKAAIELKRGRL